MITQQLRKVGNSYVVTVPKEEVERRGWHEGQLLALQLTAARGAASSWRRSARSHRRTLGTKRGGAALSRRPLSHGCQLRYPTLAEVIAIHEKVHARPGRAPRPLRDEGLLESALTRPQMAAYYEGADIVRQAALLGDRHLAGAGISRWQQAHRFPDARCFSLGEWLGVRWRPAGTRPAIRAIRRTIERT